MQQDSEEKRDQEDTFERESVETPGHWPFARAVVVSIAFSCVFWGILIYFVFFR